MRDIHRKCRRHAHRSQPRPGRATPRRAARRRRVTFRVSVCVRTAPVRAAPSSPYAALARATPRRCARLRLFPVTCVFPRRFRRGSAIPAPRGVTGVGSLSLRSADARLSASRNLRHVLCLFIDDRAHRGGAHLLSNLNAKGADVCHLKHDAGLLGAFSIIHVPCAP